MAQPNSKQWQSLLLYSEFGEFCTMCEAMLLCTESEQLLPQPAGFPMPDQGADQSATLYHLKTRSFWSQIATIWEWFVANFDTINGHQRPVVIYAIDQGQWSPGRVETLTITVEPALITVGDSAIDRKTRQWLAADNLSAKGYCQRLPLWETLALIETRQVNHD
ncbi:hypothetical protein BST96_08415 [Oceanicoccus sagamiensis]|uniref:Uncharacterized protein n=2 Tax=Oceanicoccus sagamiensis TaxID=716816 RepID=A0A1X9NCJ5_9GAMM|nr:hypothetical protein BST96_08415 [Oceanicoccus sagamiensis]